MNAYVDRIASYRNIDVSAASDMGTHVMTLHNDGGPLVLASGILTQLSEALKFLATQASLRCLILTGSGDTFSRRERFDRARALLAPHILRSCAEEAALCEVLMNLNVPKLAALNGPVAPPANFLLLFDHLIATPHATLAERPYLETAFPALGPSTESFSRSTRPASAAHAINAVEAKRWGLIQDIVPPESLMKHARQTADRMAQFGCLPD